MAKRRRSPGRPPRIPGHDFRIRDIPERDFQRFREWCARPPRVPMRDILIQVIRRLGHSGEGFRETFTKSKE